MTYVKSRTITDFVNQYTPSELGHHKFPHLPDDYVSSVSAAKLLGVTQNTLFEWRKKNIGPAYIIDVKDGCKRPVAWYRLDDVYDWVDSLFNNPIYKKGYTRIRNKLHKNGYGPVIVPLDLDSHACRD